MANLPAPEIPEGHYSRLCPGDWAAHPEDKLRELAFLMRDSKAKRAARKRTLAMPSGYVYLGQFIDHDLTRDNRSLAEAGPDAERTVNHRTPRLDLDHLFGRNADDFPELYENDGRLRLGLTSESTLEGGRRLPSTLDDLSRNGDGSARIIDPRNDENLIVAQIHVLLAKFYNRFVSLLPRMPELSVGPEGATFAAQARRLVTWHYQWLIWHDFLPRFVRADVLGSVFTGGLRLFPRTYDPSDYPMAIPIEFTGAAYRFGHSMIQTEYGLNLEIGGIPATELIAMTQRGGKIGPGSPALPASHVIDWDFFFEGSDAQLNRGQNISTFIPEILYGLPPEAAESFRRQNALRGAVPIDPSQHPSICLPEVTLLRGSRMRLPSGEELARYFGEEPLSHDLVPATPGDKFFFEDPAFKGRTPLWYYFLREAAVQEVTLPESVAEPELPIQKLGSLGSRVVADVFYQILAADRHSILHAGRGWRPPAFVFGKSRRLRPIDSMAALVEFARAG
ncbi:MAG TPA: peroxidase family protein [Chthoniobacterales bacterium]